MMSNRLSIALAGATAFAMCLTSLGGVAQANEISSSNHFTQDKIAVSTVNSERVYFDSSNTDFTDLDVALMSIFKGQGKAGKLAYKTLPNGNYLFFTQIDMTGGELAEFYYELPSDTVEANNLLPKAVYSPFSVRDGGNEWYPKIWAGKDSKGTWVRFNRSAQGLMYGAAGTALKVAICAIPGVNTVGCAVVWGATQVAKIVMKKIGRCSASRPWLYIYPSQADGSCKK